MIDKAKVMQVYSGKAGCVCGCLGEYFPSDEHSIILTKRDRFNISRAVNLLNRRIQEQGGAFEAKPDHINNAMPGLVYHLKEPAIEYFCMETRAGRNYTIYIKRMEA